MAGYVHVYTGNGKGKTTAALGLAIRAAGAGWNVFFAQFAKGVPSSEHVALKRFSDRITIRQYGQPSFIYHGPDRMDVVRAEAGLAECREAILSGQYRLVVLDEANLGPILQLFTVDELLALVDLRPDDVELVITGRGADRRLLDRADLVTEMQEIKHYYQRGVLARTGIEK
jgi:cob(I)alamin adenosyltransferase